MYIFYLTGLSSSPASPSQEVTVIPNLKLPLVNFSFGFLHMNEYIPHQYFSLCNCQSNKQMYECEYKAALFFASHVPLKLAL